ncbi:MAG: hypothetical protein U0325_03720 [Polyangiales bacterium]
MPAPPPTAAPAAPAAAPPAAVAPAAAPAAAPTANNVGTPQPAALTVQQTVQTLVMQSGAATVFRRNDGNWHVRVSYAVRNTGAEPVDVQRESFHVDEMGISGDLSSFPDHITINPGLTVTGDITWWRGATDPQPRAITVRYRPGDENAPVLGTQSYTPVFSPAQPAPGTAPTAAVFTLAVTATSPGLTFVHNDGNRHFRVNLQVRNTTTAPLLIHREMFHATVGTTEAGLASQPELTTWADPATVAPGASVTGSLGFWLSGDPAPNPTSLHITFGPTVSPQATLDAPVTAGPSPLQ